MSPEQAAGEKNLDGRSDLYALGCVLYEMLAGQPPFTGPTVESLVRQHLAADPPRVTAIRPTVPASVTAVLHQALAKTPADRFSSLELFADALGDAERGNRETEGTTPPPRVRPARPRSLSTSLLVLVAAAALTWLGWRALQPGARSISFAATRQVSREPALEIQAAISPDGREIVFHATRNATRDIYLVNADGTGEQRLTSDSGESLQAAFSPDGVRIAYINNSPRGIYLLRRETTGGGWSAPELLAAAGSLGTLNTIKTITLAGTERTLIAVHANSLRSPRWPE